MHGVVVIGAGHAGVQLAASLRAGDYCGPITLVGDERGLPYQRPPVSKEMLADEADPADFALRPASFFTEGRISLVTGRAVGIDRDCKRVTIAGGRRLHYDHLVLATGAAPRSIAVPGRTLTGVRHLRSAADALALGRSLRTARRAVVLGGGFIGLEVAGAASARGLEVSVLERGDRLLGQAVSAPVSAAVAAHHRAAGVRLLLGEQAVRIEGRDGRVAGVRTASGRLLEADLVVVGLGAVPEDGLARQAGLDTRDGVLVDDWLTTSDPSISALGDCASVLDPSTGEARRLTSVQNATDQGDYLARATTSPNGSSAPSGGRTRPCRGSGATRER
jgi:3-phenylpropionate/trans-cinnamate dioxygenase ferredoxin reductase subunit